MKIHSWFEDKNWTLLEFHGKDRTDFLHRLTTNELPVRDSPLVHNFFLTVNAKILAEFWVSTQEDHLALLTPTSQVSKLKECVDQYHFGEEIKILEPKGSLFVLSLEDQTSAPDFSNMAKPFSPDPRHGPDCHWCFVNEKSLENFESTFLASTPEMTPTEREFKRISQGRPKFGIDYNENTLFVEMAQLDDFSESKGCYPGQEIVARVLHRGRLNKHLRAFRSEESIKDGWVSKVGSKEVACVRSVLVFEDGTSQGYLLVRREHGDEGSSLTGEDGTKLTVTSRPGEVLTGEDE